MLPHKSSVDARPNVVLDSVFSLTEAEQVVFRHLHTMMFERMITENTDPHWQAWCPSNMYHEAVRQLGYGDLILPHTRDEHKNLLDEV